MNTNILAIYEHGVFRPREAVDLPDRCEVRLVIHPDTDALSEPKEKDDRELISIEDQIAALASKVPLEEWDRLPRDLSEQVDHYVYGTPKR